MYHLQQLKETPEWMIRSTVHSEVKPFNVHGEIPPNSDLQSQLTVTGLCVCCGWKKEVGNVRPLWRLNAHLCVHVCVSIQEGATAK